MGLTRKISSGGTVANFATYVGETGHLFYDSSTGELRISDGVTAGGQPLIFYATSASLGDFAISGNTLSTVNNNEDINLVAPGTGSLHFYGGGGLLIHSDGIDSPIAVDIQTSGLTAIRTVSPMLGTPVLSVSSNPSTSTFPLAATTAGGLIQLTGPSSGNTLFTIDNFDNTSNTFNGPSISLRRFLGTVDSPTAVTENTLLGSVVGYGYDGSIINVASATGMAILSEENFTPTAHGAKIQFFAVPTGQTNPVKSASIDSTGINAIALSTTSTTNATSSTTGAITTAGGLGVAQNAWIGGNLWVNDVYTSYVGSTNNSNLTLQAGSSSNETLAILANLFTIQTTTNPNPVFQITSTGNTVQLVPTFNSNQGAHAIIGSADGSFVNPVLSGVMLHVTGQPATASRVYNDGAANYAAFIGRRYDGTSASPTAVQANEIIARFGGTPYNTTGMPSISTVRIDMVAAENQTGTNQGNRIEFWSTPTGSTTISKILSFNNTGITFSDTTVQNTAGIPLSYLGAANGVATLNGAGQIPTSQLPAGATVYQGGWNANTNTPTLTNGTGTAGYEYAVTTAGTTNFGAGNITFNAGDFVIYSGSVWQRIPTASGVTSFNTRTGAVTLTSSDVTTALTYTPYNGSTNPNGYLTSSTLGSYVSTFNTRSGAVTLSSSDVTTALSSGSIANAKLANSSITINSTAVSLGSSITGIVTTSDTGTVTNTMLAGSISNTKLSNSSITINSTAVSLGSSITGIVTTSDTGTVTNTMLAGSIANAKLSNSSITINSTAVSLGSSITGIVTTSDTGTVSNTMLANSTISGVALGSNLNSVTAGFGLKFSSGTTYNGSAAETLNNYYAVTGPVTPTGSGANNWTYSLDLGAANSVVVIDPGGNFTGTVTITGTPVVGKLVRLIILEMGGGTKITVSGLTVTNSTNGTNQFSPNAGPGAPGPAVVELLSTTTALSGVYMILTGAK